MVVRKVAKAPVAPSAEPALFPVLQQVEAAVTAFLRGQALRGAPVRVGCARGCSACCRQTVLVGEPEAIAVAEHVRSLPADRQHELRQRLAAVAQETKDLTPAARKARRIACAFLDDDGACAVYAVRPFNCRQLAATDAAACIASNENPEDFKVRLERGLAAAPNIIAISQVVGAHASAYYRQVERSGLTPTQLDLCRAVDALLDDEALAGQWRRGKPILRHCRVRT